jgi:hypothetical protein
MATITINKFDCKISDCEDINILRKLDHLLSYQIQGAMFMPSYSGWDGRVRLLSKNLHFSYGLLNKVSNFFTKHGVTVSIVDNRTKSESKPINIIPILEKMDKTPRYYQLDAAKATLYNDCGIIRIPTGGGKALVSALIVANFGKPSIIFVIGKDLLYQMYELYKDIFGADKVGIVGDGLCDIKKYNVVSVWTAGSALGLKKNQIA